MTSKWKKIKTSTGSYRVYVYWLDEPDGLIWSIDDGNQDNEDIYKEVIFSKVYTETKSNLELTHKETLKKREPKAWIEVFDAVLFVNKKTKVAVFEPRK